MGLDRDTHVKIKSTVCQDIADTLDEGGRYRRDYNRLFQGF
jgi:hypothetical protein